MRTTPAINALAVAVLMFSTAILTRHVIITESTCPGIAHHSEPHQQRSPEQ